jgi:thiamine biosynthesis lipoprotein
VPSDTELAEAMLHTDIAKIEIDKSTSSVRLCDADMRLDVGAVAKGFTEEKIAEWLKANGKSGYAIDMGGNLRAVGKKPSGEGFSTGIRNPNTELGGFVETLTITDEASATSGGYERFYEIGGVRYHHIIDKDTLRPADRYLSATVITESAALADALSTAVFCMSEDEIEDMLGKSDSKIKVIIVDKSGSILRFDN